MLSGLSILRAMMSMTNSAGESVTPPCQEERRAIRQLAGACQGTPVKVVAGDRSPSLKGTSYYWTTPNGTLVQYPNAYRRAFGKPVYHPSTSCVVVGVEWLYNWRKRGGVYTAGVLPGT